MRAQEFLIERAERARDAIENIVSMGNADDYFVRFTDIDKLGYSAKQDFGRTPDIGSADYDPDALPRKTGRPALWFYPAKYYLQNQNLFASNKPYVWLVKKRPNAYLQPTAKATAPSVPNGMTRAGLMHKESGVPVAIFFRPEFDVVDRWHEPQHVRENFDDGKKPGRKGLAKQVGVNCKQSVSKLRKIAANSSGERQRMAHWCANMKSGKKKANEAVDHTTVEDFIEKIYSEYPQSPFNPNQHAILTGDGEHQTIALFELEPSKSVKGAVELHWIQAYPQRQGVGTAAIRELQVKACKAGLKMSLYPKPNGKVSQASLKRLYKRLGFNPIHQGAATMVWDPALDEDWRNWAAGLGAAATMGGLGAGLAYDHAKSQPQQSQAQVQQVRAPQAKVQAPVAQNKPASDQQVQQAQKTLSDPDAQLLQKTAQAAGIKGTELAQFMAQCAHESANFTTTKEFGDKNYFKKYDIKHNPSKAKVLGNVRPGDGELYKGRGYIQLTGRENYRKAGEALGLPLEKKPQLAERPEIAAKIAVWFWKNRVKPQVDNFADTAQATKPINPALKGLQDRHDKFTGMKMAMAKPQQVKPTPKPVAKPTKVVSAPTKVKRG